MAVDLYTKAMDRNTIAIFAQQKRNNCQVKKSIFSIGFMLLRLAFEPLLPRTEMNNDGLSIFVRWQETEF